MASNGIIFVKVCPNGYKWVRIGQIESKLLEIGPKGTKLVQKEQLGPNRSKLFSNGP